MSTKKDTHASDFLAAQARNQRAVDNLPEDKAKNDDKLARQYNARNQDK